MGKIKTKTKNETNNQIAKNRRARFDYEINQTIEAGLVLMGWEVKSIRAGKAQLADTYVVMQAGEAFLLNSTITPLNSASTHVATDPTRSRKLLLHKRELALIHGMISRKNLSCIPLELYWKGVKIKLRIGIGRGKKQYDKRASIRQKEWNKERGRALREKNKV